MFWKIAVLLLILSIVGYFWWRRGKITLTSEQAELVRQLALKERLEIERKRQHIINEGALQGKTISIEMIFSKIKCKSKARSEALDKLKSELLDKYGPNIKVDEAYRLMNKLDPEVWEK